MKACEFKIGDMIRCSNNERMPNRITRGAAYRVHDIAPRKDLRGYVIRIQDNLGALAWFFDDRFEKLAKVEPGLVKEDEDEWTAQ